MKPTEKKILGVKWEKENDTLSVQLGSNSEKRTDHTKDRTCCMPHGNQFGQQYKQSSLSIIPHEKHCWSDSTVALWCITGEG